MASEDIKEALKAAAVQIRDEKLAGANTAFRVGSLFLAICEALNLEPNELAKYFLRKDQEDTAQEIITFLKGLVTDVVKSSDFSSGELGSGFVLRNDAVGSYLEIDRMLVRRAAYFVELIIKSLKHVGGTIVLTPASIKCSRVEEHDTFYRCIFENERDGKVINQEFVIGDQARAQSFNVKEGLNHNMGSQYYWRLVVSTGDNYIDLSKSDCADGSLAPLAGDEIVQLGNRDDSSRQNAIILSTVGDDAPSFKLYLGICDYSLSGKEVIVISPKRNVFTGRFKSSTSDKDYDAMLDEFGTDLSRIKEQTDKVMTIWFFQHEPTLENEPASDWDDSDKADHEYDIFYYSDEGLAWRFIQGEDGSFSWVPITDQQTLAALEKAHKAQQTADAVTERLDEIVSDGILSSLEKKEVLKEWETVSVDYATNTANAKDFGIDSTAYTAAYMALGKYLNGDADWDTENTPAWLADLSTNQEIVPGDYRSRWTGYYDAEKNLLNAISVAVDKKADEARQEADKANGSISEIVSDGILSALEKKEVLKEWEEIVSAYSKNTANAKDFGIDSTAYTAAYMALGKYLNGDADWDTENTPAWLADLSTNQEIVPGDYRSRWTGYYDAEISLLDSVSRVIRQEAGNAQNTADSKCRNFVSKPIPPYSKGDRWCNAVYPADGDDKGTTYNNDDLVCSTPKTAGEEFDISDWVPSSGQDSRFRKTFYSEIERLDKKITSSVGEGSSIAEAVKTAQKAAEAADKAAAGALDVANRKVQNFQAQPTPPYNKGDRWSNAVYPASGDTKGSTYNNDDLVCITAKAADGEFDIADWQPTSCMDSGQKKLFATAITQSSDYISAISAAFDKNEDGSLKLNEDGIPILTSAAGSVITSESAKLYATKDDVKAEMDVRVKFDPKTKEVLSDILLSADQINMTADDYISIINKGTTTISASRLNLVGAVTFSMFSSGLQDTINGKVTQKEVDASVKSLKDTLKGLAYKDTVEQAMKDETLIVGGYIKTELIDVDSLVAKKVSAASVTGESLDIDTRGLSIKDSGGYESLRIYGADKLSYIDFNSSAGYRALMQTSLLTYSYGNLTTKLSSSGVVLGAGSSISGFALGYVGSAFADYSDFSVCSGTVTLPSPSTRKGKVVFLKLTGSTTIRSSYKIYKGNEYSLYPYNEDTGYYSSSFSSRSLFFISDGTAWYEFLTYYRS